VLAAAILAHLGQLALASAALLLAALLSLDGWRALRRARRSRVGAESEALVRRALEPLERDGWQVRHALDWAGAGDLDHVVRAPSGSGFVIETKTLRYTPAHLARTLHAARWLTRTRRRYPHGVRPVICLARGRRIDRLENGVRVVSLDRIARALRREAAARRD
jgi:Nuclease-related domain